VKKLNSVLVVDDEKEIVELIDFYLKNNEYNTYRAFNGKEALEIFEKEQIDIIILDIMMPKLDGKEVLRKIRNKSNTPIIFLSAKGEDIDKIDGLFLGADDYLAKPFNPIELIARVKALLRRSTVFNNQREESTSIIINEYKLICFLMKNQNKVFTKGQLYEQVWDQSYLGDEKIIMVYISKLRDKIEYNPKEPKFIKTIRGLGYIFEGK
jgi:DNA-binding response OmpR family regulator